MSDDTGNAEQINNFIAGLKTEFEPKQEQYSNVLFYDEGFACIFFISIILTLVAFFVLLVRYRKKFLSLYSIKGRVTRKTYWKWWFLTLPIFVFYTIFFSIFPKIILYNIYWLEFIFLASFMLVHIPYICVQIRRLHDMNLSGIWYLTCLLINHTPLIIIKWIFLGCVRGSKGANKYGELPQEIKNHSQAKIKTFFCNLKTKLKNEKSINMTNKKPLIISFLVGLFLAIIIMYALSNRYVSYQSYKSKIVRIDKWTGETHTANVFDSYPQWCKINEKNY